MIISYGNIVESWLWNHGGGVLAVESSLWNPGCGILAVESLQMPGDGFLASESWLWLPSLLLGNACLARACGMWIPGTLWALPGRSVEAEVA